MASRVVLICLLLFLSLDSVVAAVTGSGPIPRAGGLHFKSRAKRDPSTVFNPLISARQVKADTIRRGPTKTSKRADCPTPQVSGGCCPPGTTLCSGTHEVGGITVCSDLTNDHDNCRACGYVCGDAETCIDGDCTPCDTSVYPFQVVCGNTCTVSDNANCAACGSVCSTGQCSGTECCTSGLTACDGNCIDTSSSDPLNCGGCNVQCGAHQFCDQYFCGDCSEDDPVVCDNVCSNFQSSPWACGGCGIACDTNIELCSSGICCPYGTTNCGGVCTDLESSFENCKSCGHACGPQQICSLYECINCPSGYPFCGPDQLCTDIYTDNLNCGACGSVCSGTCVDGVCCPSDSTLICDSQCTNGNADPGDCGTCGNVCSISTFCGNGACLPCTQGYLQCDGSCEMWSVDHCGSCTHQCAPGSSGCTLYGPGTGPWKSKYCCVNADGTISNDCVG